MIARLKLSHIAALSIITFAAAGTAIAKPAPQGKQKRKRSRAKLMKKFDTNRDGRIDRTERAAMFQTRIKRLFKRLDTNRDNRLTMAEIAKVRRARFAYRLIRADLNQDSVVTRGELRKAINQTWRKKRRGNRGTIRNHQRRGPRFGKARGKRFKRNKRYNRNKRMQFGAMYPSPRVAPTRMAPVRVSRRL